MHQEGGLYVDYDRWSLIPLDEVLGPTVRLLVPTFCDNGPVQDLMASPPGNKLFHRAIQLNIARRRLGWTSIMALGPHTYDHAVARVLLGAPDHGSGVSDVERSADFFAQYGGASLRTALGEVPGGLIQTVRESPPCSTATARVRGLLCCILWPLARLSKRSAYQQSGVRHWTSAAPRTSRDTDHRKTTVRSRRGRGPRAITQVWVIAVRTKPINPFPTLMCERTLGSPRP